MARAYNLKTPFTKGNKYGSKKGRHRKTKEWEALGDSIITKHAERFNSILDEADDDTFARLFIDTLEYFKPKLQRTELKADDNNILRPVIVLPPVAEKPQALPNREKPS